VGVAGGGGPVGVAGGVVDVDEERVRCWRAQCTICSRPAHEQTTQVSKTQ